MTRDDINVVLDRVRDWPHERQAALARIALTIEAQDTPLVPEDEATKAAIAEGLAQAERGEFASEDEIETVFARFRA